MHWMNQIRYVNLNQTSTSIKQERRWFNTKTKQQNHTSYKNFRDMFLEALKKVYIPL